MFFDGVFMLWHQAMDRMEVALETNVSKEERLGLPSGA